MGMQDSTAWEGVEDYIVILYTCAPYMAPVPLHNKLIITKATHSEKHAPPANRCHYITKLQSTTVVLLDLDLV